MSSILIEICIYATCSVFTAFAIKKTLLRDLDSFEMAITAFFWPLFAILAIIASIIKLIKE